MFSSISEFALIKEEGKLEVKCINLGVKVGEDDGVVDVDVDAREREVLRNCDGIKEVDKPFPNYKDKQNRQERIEVDNKVKKGKSKYHF